MREVLPELMAWWRDGKTIGVGTVVGTWRSAPRPAGASMLVGPGNSAVGSVSGGCVEGAVYDLARQVVADGQPVRPGTGAIDLAGAGARLPSPIGLDLGARTSEETGVSILAEIIALRWGGGGGGLALKDGRIHHGEQLT